MLERIYHDRRELGQSIGARDNAKSVVDVLLVVETLPTRLPTCPREGQEDQPSARSWGSTRSACGTGAARARPWRSCAPRGARSPKRTPSGSRRSATSI
jgi:hypothetical protein